MKNPKEIGEILKEARQKKGLTTDKIYKAIRIQPTLIEALEQGTADSILSRVYIISFLKKYASLLNLDGDALAANYKAFYSSEEKQLFRIEKEPLMTNLNIRKWIIPVISIALTLIFIILIVILSIKLKSARLTKKTASLPIAELALDQKDAAKTVFPIPNDKPIELVLRSADDVWMKVKKDKKIVFEGTLRKNEKKMWTADNKIELWVGRAEALYFTINGKPVGRIGKGRIKNIQISRQGLKIRNKWLLKAEE